MDEEGLMSRIREEMRVVPRAAWIIAVAVYVTLVVLLWSVFLPKDPKFSSWPGWGLAVFAGGVPLFTFVYVLLIGYVNGDARRRGMRHVLWTLLAIFIPNAIGVILYFILRDPPMRNCPQCGAVVRGAFAFCPACGTALAPVCPACRQVVEPGWSHCPSCGRGLHAA
jgi:hypothetical protein